MSTVKDASAPELSYEEFLKAKSLLSRAGGFPCDPSEVNPVVKPHARDIICWAVRGGRRAVFAAFGLNKSVIQLETLRLILEKSGGKHAGIVLPLGVRQEFVYDADVVLARGDHPKISDEQRRQLAEWQDGRPDRIIKPRFIRSHKDLDEPGIYTTNYESVRDSKFDPTVLDGVSLDEASCLRGFGGTKTFREFMRIFEGTDAYRFAATATPSPNEYIELLAYAAFLDVMDVGQAKTRFFKRNSEKADQLTIHPHKLREFWLWVSSWAIFVQRPSDLGHSDEGYEIPPLNVVWHEIPSDHKDAGQDNRGQGRLIKSTAMGVVGASREKRDSLGDRVQKMLEIRAKDPTVHRIYWHDLENERKAIEKAIPGIATVYGNQDLDVRDELISGFSNGKIPELAGKPSMLGSGCNFQRHCNEAVFLGIGFKFNDFIQAVHRIQRFLQEKPVTIHLIYTEAEREVRSELERKWKQREELVANMTEIIKEFGLSEDALQNAMGRTLGIERQESSGKGWLLANNDCVPETAAMEADSVHLILTSIPFSTQYEYSPSFNDFGHTDDNAHFWAQMDYLITQLYRVLQPGRVAAIHVKDRITPGGINGFGFQTVQPFSDETITAFTKHGFAFIARKTIVTDVVRENAQTYRLGWTEQCKDGSRMGCGMPEYLLLFRKPPTDRSNGYADVPVEKAKKWHTEDGWDNPDGYSRARWQFDAHGFTRSSGNRLLAPEDLKGLPAEKVFKLFKKHSLDTVYDFEHDVSIAEYLDKEGCLPPSFMLLQPQSWHPDVWTDVTRMRTLNGAQYAKGKELHLCPLQFDIVDRVIEQFSMKGETVYDPFAGLGTVPLRAVEKERIGRGCELARPYWWDSIFYLKSAEEKASTPTLFDAVEIEALEDVA